VNCPDPILTDYIYVLECHTVPHKYIYNDYVSIKNKNILIFVIKKNNEQIND
jgi:hypothetical protein